MAESSFSSRAADDLTAELTKAAQKSRSRCCRNRTTLERVVIWNRITCCSDLLNYASISMYDKNMFLMYQLGSIGDATNRQTIYRYIDDFSSFAMSPTMWTKNENDVRFAWNHITTSQQKKSGGATKTEVSKLRSRWLFLSSMSWKVLYTNHSNHN